MDVENAKISLGPKIQQKLDSYSTARGARHGKFVMPIAGMRLPQFILAKRLMNQKATAVADVAATLRRLGEGKRLTPQQTLASTKQQKKERELLLSGKALKRLAEIRTKEAAKAAEIDNRQEFATPRPGYARIEKHTLSRISMEYDGTVDLSRGGLTEADLFDLKAEATEAEIGAQQALDQALTMMQTDKDAETDTIAKRISAQVEERIAKMTAAEREQAQREHETARRLKQEEVDARIRKVAEDLKQEREAMQALYPSPNKEQQAQLHRQKNLAASTLAQTKKAAEQGLSWVGLYAEIGPAVDQALAKIDEAWRPKLAQLQQDVDQEKAKQGDAANHDVEIRWADIRDATYAREWSDSVVHVELQPKAVIKTAGTSVRQHFHLDEDEQPIPEQLTSMPRTQASSVHVFGSDIPEPVDGKPVVGRYWPPEQRAEHVAQTRAQRIAEWAQTEVPMLRDRIIAIRQQAAHLRSYFQDVPLDSNLQVTGYCIDAISYARQDLDRMVQDGRQNEIDLKHVADQLSYINREITYAESEVSIASQTPDADRARLDWIKLQAELLEIESKNFAALEQAVLRDEFFAKCAEREELHARLNGSRSNYETELAVGDLAKFHDSFPVLADAEERAGIVEKEEQKVQLSAEIATMEETLKSKTPEEAQQLRAQLGDMVKQRDDLSVKIDEAVKELKNDRVAWLDFKRGKTAGYNAAVSQNQRPVMEEGRRPLRETADPGEPEQKGLWSRVKGLLGRK